MSDSNYRIFNLLSNFSKKKYNLKDRRKKRRKKKARR
jgi:hypothetical protein